MYSLLNDENKTREFLSHTSKLRSKIKAAGLRPEERDDPSKFINRNVEVAEVWDQYETDRKRLVSYINHEKLLRARNSKEVIEESEREAKILKAKRWEIYKKDQKLLKIEEQKFREVQDMKT